MSASGSKTDSKSAMRGLDKIRANVPSNMAARVGVLGSHAARTDDSGTTNAEIGIIHEFGSVSKNIPPRSFLRMPIETHIGAIATFMGQPAMVEKVLSGKAKEAFELMGIKAEEFVQQAFSTSGFGQWKPNAPLTIAIKGSSKPLIDTSQLRRSISSEVVNGS